MTSPIVLPRRVPVSEITDPIGVLRATGILMSEAAERLDAIERAKWVLVVMDQGEHWRCRECGGKTHPQWGREYATAFTVRCVPRPWHGFRQGLTAYFQNIGVGNPANLTTEQVARLRAIAPRIGRADALPALAAHHPELARKLATPETDADYVGLLLGNMVEITEGEARRFGSLVNVRARRTIVTF